MDVWDSEPSACSEGLEDLRCHAESSKCSEGLGGVPGAMGIGILTDTGCDMKPDSGVFGVDECGPLSLAYGFNITSLSSDV